MKRLNYSNFELVQDIIGDLKINYNSDNYRIVESLNEYWRETVGENVAKYSKLINFSKNIITVTCADSFVANELYLRKAKILEFMSKKITNLGIKIEDIKFDYKKWKE